MVKTVDRSLFRETVRNAMPMANFTHREISPRVMQKYDAVYFVT